MPDFITQTVGDGPAVMPLTLFLRALFALLLGGVVVLVYRKSRSPIEQTPSFPPTLLLMTVLITMVTQVIGDNIARSFSLVGVLSIVRFRTVVRDTLDTVFVIFAVAVGMAVGADKLWVAVVGIAIVALALLIVKSAPHNLGGTMTAYHLTVRAGAEKDVLSALEPVLDTHLLDRRLLSISSAKHGAAIDRSYEVHIKREHVPDTLVQACVKLEGVMSVDLTTPQAGNGGGDHPDK
jgi:uncharacterized membrane protein YhiD involved in acid resistance